MSYTILTNRGPTPCIISETGIPFDMDNKKAYTDGNYQSQIKAMDAHLFALEGAKLNYTLWNYCPINDNVWGDQWNGEDLSLWSKPAAHPPFEMFSDDANSGRHELLSSSSDRSDDTLVPADSPNFPYDAALQAGSRAFKAFVRPAPILVCGGEFAKYNYDMSRATFDLTILPEIKLCKAGLATEIFVPPTHHGPCPEGIRHPRYLGVPPPSTTSTMVA